MKDLDPGSLRSGLTIESLTVRPVCVPMAPHRTASGEVTESPLVLTDIVLDGGVGHSVIFTYTRAALKPTAELLSNMEPLLIGRALAPLDLEAELSRRFRLLGTQGLVGMALAAVDMALWDALARERETSLVALLGGREYPVPIYGGVGYDGVAGSAEAAERWARQGARGVKAKIGYPTVDEDIEVIRAMRSTVGDELAVMVDYNQSLGRDEALERLTRLESENLTWVEEPLLAHDHEGHARLARHLDVPIQCGENWWGILDMEHAVAAGASDYVMPDAMKIGGVTGWLRAARLAESQGIPVSSHLWPEISAQLLCLTPTRHWLEYADWWNPVVAEPLVVDGGVISLDDTLGSGVEWNERAVEQYLI